MSVEVKTFDGKIVCYVGGLSPVCNYAQLRDKIVSIYGPSNVIAPTFEFGVELGVSCFRCHGRAKTR